MESLAVDDDRVVFLQIGGCGQVVVLIPLIAFQPSEFNVIKVALYDLLAQPLIVTARQHDMYVGAVGRHEIGEAQISIAIAAFINGGAPARRMRFRLQSPGIKRLGFAARSERSSLIDSLVDPKFLRTENPPGGDENWKTDRHQDQLSAPES